MYSQEMRYIYRYINVIISFLQEPMQFVRYQEDFVVVEFGFDEFDSILLFFSLVHCKRISSC